MKQCVLLRNEIDLIIPVDWCKIYSRMWVSEEYEIAYYWKRSTCYSTTQTKVYVLESWVHSTLTNATESKTLWP